MTKGIFDFKDWDKAFDLYQTLLKNGESVQITISSDFFTSGFWVESVGSRLTTGDIAYDTEEKVLALKRRIEDEIALAKKEGRSPHFTT